MPNYSSTNFMRILSIDLLEDRLRGRLNIQMAKVSRVKFTKKADIFDHIHNIYELIIPTKGDYRCSLNGEKLCLHPGQILFVQPGDTHSDSYTPGNEAIFILFQLTGTLDGKQKELIFNAECPTSGRIITPGKKRFSSNMARFIVPENKPERLRDYSLIKYAEAIVWELMSLMDEKHLSDSFKQAFSDNEFAAEVEEYFKRHLKEKLDIQDLCAHLGMSRRSMENRFREFFKDTPLSVFNRMKIKIARQFLLEGCSVKNISYQLGYSSPYYFSKAYKRITGHSPSEDGLSAQ